VSKIEPGWLCIHGHFSQPPRGNPLTGEIGDEPAAAPYTNWNQRITETAYRPNAEIGNFSHISYSFGQPLLDWLAQHMPAVYDTISQSDQHSEGAEPSPGHALATAYDHVILPLARHRDKQTQITWGIAAFKQVYGRQPLGFWLPELAVDTETLTALVEAGIQYTVLAEKQVRGHVPGNAGPYRVKLPQGRSITVFVRHDSLSAELSFNIHNLGGAGRWSHQALSPLRKHTSGLILLATAGETFGHHFAGEEQFLHWLVNHEAQHAGYAITTLDQYFVQHPPQKEIQIVERTSWGIERGLAEWTTGQTDNPHDTTWKGALRRALDNTTSEIDHVYASTVQSHKVDPWALRESYIAVILGTEKAETWITQQVPDATPDGKKHLLTLLRAQQFTQHIYTSYTFTDNQLDGRQSQYAITCAALAADLVRQAGFADVGERFAQDLAVMTSQDSAVTGAAILRDVLATFHISL
jgi:alpha-amylase/alpha-mannosidase (GH57 family)